MWRAISGYTDFPRVIIRTSGKDIAPAGGKENISFTVHTTTLGQSVYPDIALHIRNYCVYCIEDQNLTHTQYKCTEIFMVSRNQIGNAILGMNNTLQTMNIFNVLLIRIIEGVLKFLCSFNSVLGFPMCYQLCYYPI